MRDKIESKALSRHGDFSLLELAAALSVAAPALGLARADAEAQTGGMEQRVRRDDRYTDRHTERRTTKKQKVRK